MTEKECFGCIDKDWCEDMHKESCSEIANRGAVKKISLKEFGVCTACTFAGTCLDGDRDNCFIYVAGVEGIKKAREEKKKVAFTDTPSSLPFSYYKLPSTKKIIVLNGPPGCGKDTLTTWLMNNITSTKIVCHTCFKRPMYAIAAAAMGVSEKEFMARYDNRELKEKPWDKAGGLTIRQLMIKVSEEWIKPTFGEDHFGKMCVASIAEGGCDITILSDGGFNKELAAVTAAYGEENVYIIRLYRDGHSFEGDSRGYLDRGFSPCLDLHLVDGCIDVAGSAIMRFVNI